MYKKIIKDALIKAGATDVGFLAARKFLELSGKVTDSTCFSDVDEEKRINPFLIMESAKTIITYVVSYKSDIVGNISSYAYGRDYHLVLKEIGKAGIEILKNRGYLGVSFSDTGDLPERYLAYLSGLGVIGKNHSLIHPKFGSFVFIGYIITDGEFEADTPVLGTCMDCGKCLESCPTDALLTGDFKKCLSFITQKKGELSEKEENLIKKTGCIWGCDICQRVCPHNEASPEAENVNFTKDLITKLNIPEDISNREFREKFGDRAFSWRGKNVLIRNQRIVNK